MNTDNNKCLWEILIPTIRNNGKPIKTRFHRIWDKKVREISGGLTVMPVAKGQWIFQEKIFSERMIPVRLIATRSEIEQVVQLSLKYYEQLAILAYKISDEVILRHADKSLDKLKQ